jgi:hypothetical protein
MPEFLCCFYPGSSSSSGVAVTASVFTMILYMVGASTVSLAVGIIILHAKIIKIKGKESSVYEEVDIQHLYQSNQRETFPIVPYLENNFQQTCVCIHTMS